MALAAVASFTGAAVIARSAYLRHVLAPVTSGPRRRSRFVLMIVQTALVVMVCTQAVRLMAGTARTLQANIGFHRSDLITATLTTLSDSTLPANEQWARNLRIHDDLTRAGLRTALSASLPLSNASYLADTAAWPHAHGVGAAPMADIHAVTPSYFQLTGIRFVAGQPFERDSETVVINQALATMLFGTTNAVGQRIALCRRSAEVSGVVETKPRGLFTAATPEFYVAYQALPSVMACGYGMLVSRAYLVVDASQGTGRIRTTVQRVARTEWPDALLEFETFRQLVWHALGVVALLTAGISTLALVAILLLAGGSAGMVKQHLLRSSREIAIKIALGASSGRVLADLGRPLGVVALGGLIFGGLGIWGASRLMTHLSPDLTQGQAGLGAGLTGAALLLIVTGAVTCWRPMNRAAHANPIDILRSADE